MPASDRKSSGIINSMNGAPEEIRTPDPQIRSLVLYPAELRARDIAGMGASLIRPRGQRKSYPPGLGLEGNLALTVPSGPQLPDLVRNGDDKAGSGITG